LGEGGTFRPEGEIRLTSDQAELRAYHEAGHAAVAHALHVPVTKLTLDCTTTMRKVGCPLAGYHQGLIAMGGPFAEERHQGGHTAAQQKVLWRGDWAIDLHNAARNLVGSDIEVALRRAQQIVNANWHLIELLARVLAGRQELAGREITAVLGRGP
jgi:ATP-dependent Zn protease